MSEGFDEVRVEYTALPRSRESYWARAYLRAYGGLWDSHARRWMIPSQRLVEARQALELARRAREDLVLPEGGLPDLLVCYQCGERFSPGLAEASPGECYCGCVERERRGQRRYSRRGVS